VSPNPRARSLRALAARPLAERWPALAGLVPDLRHPDPAVRAAAAACLAGAEGPLALTPLVDALDDADPDVRLAALAALRVTAEIAPGRWVHALFHRRDDVRAAAARTPPPPGTEPWRLHTLADGHGPPVLRVHPRDVHTLVAWTRRGALPEAVAARILTDADWRDIPRHDAPPAAWDDLFALLLPHLPAAAAPALADALAHAPVPRAAALATARGAPALPAAAALLVELEPAFLTWTDVPLAIRRRAATAELAARTLPADRAAALLDAALTEAIDPERTVALLHLAAPLAEAVHRVLDAHLGVPWLPHALARDPLAWASVLTVRGVLDPRRVRQLERSLGGTLPVVIATAACRVTPDRLDFLRRVHRHAPAVLRATFDHEDVVAPDAVVERLLARLVARQPPRRNHGVTTTARLHRARLAAQAARIALLAAWLDRPAPERCPTGVALLHALARHVLLGDAERLRARHRDRLRAVLAWHPLAQPPPRAARPDVRRIDPRLPVPAVDQALAGPSRGLCALLPLRPACRPEAACALLGCHDPPPHVARMLHRADLAALDRVAVHHWRGVRTLPPLGHAWLAPHAPEHVEPFGRALLRDPRGFGFALAELLALPLLRQRALAAALDVLSRWEAEAPARFARAADVPTRALLRMHRMHLAPAATPRPAPPGDVRSGLMAGPGAVSEAHLRAHAPDDASLALILTEGRDDAVRKRIVDDLRLTDVHDDRLRRVAAVFAWGVRMGRLLCGRELVFHLPDGDALGYTRLGTPHVHVSPLAMLRGEPRGRDRVEGLVLHEIGHHCYHAAPADLEIWARAQREGLGPLLNLVADEHLERRLRARDPRFGDRLKRLVAGAFHHGNRDLPVGDLFATLGVDAAATLSACRLDVARRDGLVRIRSGSLLGALSRRDGAFARFFRALRLGTGARGDERVAEALQLFGPGFKRLGTADLLEIARRLGELFADDCALAAWCTHEGAPGGCEGLDLRDEDVQREVRRILDIPPLEPDGPTRGGGGGGPALLNVGLPADVVPIDEIVKLPPAPAAHRELVAAIRRWVPPLRAALERVGADGVAVGGRLRGRRVDRGRLEALVLRRDPHVLVAREAEPGGDLCLVLAIDCSGSMSGARHARARAFGALVAEAARGLAQVDARLFGFTDRRIFDAGTADAPAVASLPCEGGNNDAAALWHAAAAARRSHRAHRVLVMVSDGLPTQCSVATLRGLVGRLDREGFVCAQVAVGPISEPCFPDCVPLLEPDLGPAAARFGASIAGWVARATGRSP
jgi:hypothetical protein